MKTKQNPPLMFSVRCLLAIYRSWMFDVLLALLLLLAAANICFGQPVITNQRQPKPSLPARL